MKYLTFGEIMLRISPDDAQRLGGSGRYDAVYGGAEANVAVSLSYFGLDAAFCTVLPNNALGDGCVCELRRHGADTSFIQRGAGRMGVYFLEKGVNQLSSAVLYDREGSSIALAEPGSIDWDAAMKDRGWFHISGITPAISENGYRLSLEALKKAEEKGMKISLDVNYRAKLWQYGRKANETLDEFARYANVLVATADEFENALGLSAKDDEGYCLAALEKYKKLETVAVLSRSSMYAGVMWKASLASKDGFFGTRCYPVGQVIDSSGCGDAFSAGLIYGLNELESAEEALDFAAAAGCLKHSIRGDFNRVSAQEVFALYK